MCVTFVHEYEFCPDQNSPIRVNCPSPRAGCRIPDIQRMMCFKERCNQCVLSVNPPIDRIPPYDRQALLQELASKHDPWRYATNIMQSYKAPVNLYQFILLVIRPLTPACSIFIEALYGLMVRHFRLNPLIPTRKKILLLQIGAHGQRVWIEQYSRKLVWQKFELERRGAIEAGLRLLQYLDIGSIPKDCRECSICGVPYGEQGDGKIEYPVALPCDEKHIFGNTCVRKWLQTNETCPLDRREIIPPEIPMDQLESAICPWWVTELAGGRDPGRYYSEYGGGQFDWERYEAETPPIENEQPDKQEG